MIFDRLSNASIYRRLGARFAAGFDYLKQDFSRVADGRYEIFGEDVFAMVQSYQTKPTDAGTWEAHRKYADIQFMILGSERMGIAPIERLKSQAAYDAEKDVEFFQGGVGEGLLVTVEQGSFAIFLPHDVHMPNLSIDGRPLPVKKVVVKVKLD